MHHFPFFRRSRIARRESIHKRGAYKTRRQRCRGVLQEIAAGITAGTGTVASASHSFLF
jgi:hypothetical protein